MTRVLFHIGDAPCHGRRFHIGANDNYVDGDPRGLNITSLLADIAAKNIDYYFAEINTSTLKMVQEFNKELLANQGREIKIVKLCGAGDLFESVTTSITVSIMSSKSVSMHDGHGKPLKDYKVDPNPIDWSDMSKFERFDACVYEPVFESDLSDIKENKVEYTKRNVQLWKAARPFAKGGLRYAFAALINMGTKEKPKMTKCVIKESIFLAPDYNVASYYEEMIEIQVIAKCMAERFMLVSKGDKSLKFLSVSMVQVEKTGIYYSAEEFVDGEFVKWTNNAGEVNEEDYAATLNSFSHWTYDASNEYLVVTDLQGFRVGDAYLLTDPAITCLEDPFRFSSTNLGVKGLKKFFTTHQCNPICHYLGLKKNKYQTRPTRDCDTVKSKWIGV